MSRHHEHHPKHAAGKHHGAHTEHGHKHPAHTGHSHKAHGHGKPESHGHHKVAPVTVILDAGHGYHQRGHYDCGATRQGIFESDLVMASVRRLSMELKERGYRVVLTRDDHFDKHDDAHHRKTAHFGSQSEGLHHRTQIARKEKTKGHDVLFVSLHADAAANPKAQGIHVHHAGNDPRSAAFADIVAAELNGPKTKASTKASNFQVLRENHKAHIPALLVETGFITNKADLKRLRSESGQIAIAEHIADSIQQFVPLPTPKPHHGKKSPTRTA